MTQAPSELTVLLTPKRECLNAYGNEVEYFNELKLGLNLRIGTLDSDIKPGGTKNSAFLKSGRFGLLGDRGFQLSS